MEDASLMTLVRIGTTELLSKWSDPLMCVQATMTMNSESRRYWGKLTLENERLVFRGFGLHNSVACEHVIPLSRVIEMLMPLGKGEAASAPGSRAGAPVPFIVRHETDRGEEASYFYS